MKKLDIAPFENAFISLGNTLEKLADEQWFNAQEEIVQDTLIAGTIQKFEFVYELSIKMLKRQLKAMADFEDEIDQSDFRDVLRLSVKAGLINDIESWIKYRQMRNITSHTYDQSKAQQIYENIQNFLISAKFLVEKLKALQK
ncbi:hypothetical protein B0186_05945 [Canicola haemoglobinophilus]|uniref:Inorganic polyphosphate/ATP-NAD kinase n=1 Tax=Canicola haemoglobinophilus TaxID=733 RepID=A0A1V4B0W1_9PAST|nr:nucleotidyltransferase substrate binding protein [Canicola haemoglobinophilus]OOS00383.1 hypothetical protein B0186_05945 [Canicola haemoglobinophilus]STO59414.1 inorganic polyphosphate/ATP-NAD kinase [Canicola haemoglobinophilus]